MASLEDRINMGTNLITSHGANEDLKLASLGHKFLGVSMDAEGVEIHVFLHKDHELAPVAKDIDWDVSPMADYYVHSIDPLKPTGFYYTDTNHQDYINYLCDSNGQRSDRNVRIFLTTYNVDELDITSRPSEGSTNSPDIPWHIEPLADLYIESDRSDTPSGFYKTDALSVGRVVFLCDPTGVKIRGMKFLDKRDLHSSYLTVYHKPKLEATPPQEPEQESPSGFLLTYIAVDTTVRRNESLGYVAVEDPIEWLLSTQPYGEVYYIQHTQKLTPEQFKSCKDLRGM